MVRPGDEAIATLSRGTSGAGEAAGAAVQLVVHGPGALLLERDGMAWSVRFVNGDQAYIYLGLVYITTMTAAMSSDRLRPADRRILEYLDSNPLDYVALIAKRLGMPTGYTTERRDVLVERGLIEPVTNEAIYTLTERGECYVDEELSVARSVDA